MFPNRIIVTGMSRVSTLKEMIEKSEVLNRECWNQVVVGLEICVWIWESG